MSELKVITPKINLEKPTASIWAHCLLALALTLCLITHSWTSQLSHDQSYRETEVPSSCHVSETEMNPPAPLRPSVRLQPQATAWMQPMRILIRSQIVLGPLGHRDCISAYWFKMLVWGFICYILRDSQYMAPSSWWNCKQLKYPN